MPEPVFGWTAGPDHPRRKYPWEVWLDGQTWELEHGVDFSVTPESFVGQVRSYAARTGQRVYVSRTGTTVRVQRQS